MTSIYLVRHGQTAWNKEEIFRGRTDVPLDETGLKQAELVGQYFKGIEIHGVFSSSLSRAWQTAEKIAESHRLKVEPLEGILDMSFGLMTNITDVMGMGSSFVYVLTNDVVSYWTDGNDWTSYYETNSTTLLTDLQTPYGTTHFDYFRPTSRLFADTPDADINRAITVTQPDGGKNLYLYKDNGNSPSSIQNAPSWYCGGTDDTSAQLAIFEASDLEGELDHDDSFYWGPRQYESLSSTILTNFDANDFVSARTRNWLHTSPDDNAFALSQTLNAEQDFSPDGSNPGLSTWYGYEGKPFSSRVLESTNDNLPCNTGFITFYWDGERQEVIDHYENITRNALGYPTSDVIFGNDASCEVFIKTNRYVYAANGIDLLQHIGPDGVVQESYGYNTNHEVLTMTNALGEVTRYSYNANGQLTSIIQPNGLLTTNIYGSDGFLAQQVIVGFSTNSYTYTNGLVFTHTDERGLTITNTWDKLQRLTKVSYPDGASISYLYTNLDLIRVVDRMGFTNSYGYDPMGRKIAETNADRAVTLYSYCTCGSLESIQNALHSWTYFYYDQVGHLTNTVYADGHSVGRVYDTYGLMLNVTDSSGNSVNNYYDPDLRLYAASNAVGRVSVRAYDVNDLVTNSIDANNVSVNMTYDNLHRLLTRSYPDGGIEKFGYAPNMFGPTSYTNQIGDATLYGYDAMNRKTNETSVGVTTNQFSYNGASDLLSLTDGKNQTTSWGYDSFGRVTNKVDAAGITNFVYQYDTDNRLTIRWTPAKGSATYRYDPVGNLTNVVYPVSHSITLKYDALNRLTNMVDAVGTTVYGYDAAGQLLSEGGLWPSDTVSYSYNNRLRTALSIAAPNASAWMQSYGYDSTRRLTSVSSPAGAFNYIYDPVQLQRADELTFPNGAYITNSYDSVARLLSTVLKNSGGTVLDSESYAYNAANQRTSEMNTAGDFRNYTYDNEGELTSAIGKEAGGTANRWQEQFGYGYDPAGNLNYRTNNGFVQAFNVNNLNELSTVNRSGTLTVGGTTTSPATNVTVNTTNAFLYADATFAATNIPLVNGTNTFTAIAKDSYGRVSSNTSTAWMPLVPTYAYELNGNLLLERNAAGTITNRCFAYDDENELISVWVPNVWSNNFVYDGKLRRRIERDYTWNGSSWVQTNEIHFIYDGNVVVQERDANNLPQITYTRGTDLSGSLQGAGGIGGLLARTDMGLWTVGSGQATAFYHADGNGNITAMINNLQLIVAKYLYDSFGCTLSVSGSLAGANKYRFSSKEWNENAGLYYYLYRFYDPNLQRWPNHDPIGEPGFELLRYHNSKPPRLIEMLRQIGGNNLYEFVRNQPTDLFDSLGLHSNAGCSAIEKDMEDAFLRLSVYESAGDFANATIEMRQIALLSKAYADNGCWDPPPPPATCPAPSPVPVWPRPPGLTPVQKCGWTLVGVGLGGVMEYAWVCVFAL